jgi:hypothetical protein
LLWVATIFSLATVSDCDFIRYTFDPAVVDSNNDSGGGGGQEDMEASFGLFCFRIEALDIHRARSQDVGDTFPSLQAAQVFTIFAAVFLPLSLLLLHVAYFCQLPSSLPTNSAKRLWWTIRVLVICSVLSVLCSFSFYKGSGDCATSDRCRVGSGTILSAVTAVLLTVLIAGLFWLSPPQSPLIRCCACLGDEETATSTAVLCEKLPTDTTLIATTASEDGTADPGDTDEETAPAVCEEKLPAATAQGDEEVIEDGLDNIRLASTPSVS